MKFRLTTLIVTLLLLNACSQKTYTEEAKSTPVETKINWESKELSIQTEDSIYISGSLEYVNTDKLVIFIAGSGSTDRDCNNNAGLKTDAFKMLATHLQESGISSFRYDKRSVGKSSKTKEADMVFTKYITDITAIVDYFDKDFDKITILGHSEGALVGSIASRHKNVHSFISVSGISTGLDDVVLDQLKRYPKLLPLGEKHIEEIRNGEPLSEVNPLLKSLFRPSVVPYLKSIFAINPKEEIKKLRKPILIINGTCDIQVPIEHAEDLSSVVPHAQLIIVESMGHVLKQIKDDCSNAMEAYANGELELNVNFKKSIDAFINEN